MAIWAGNNKGRYPLPSEIDLESATVVEDGGAKDTTANILSLMIFNGSVPTEFLVSPQEANPNIQQYSAYEFDSPKSARVPAKALWDPAFPVDFTGGRVGGSSYAHLLPSGPRLKEWTDSFNQNFPVLANRGPQVSSVHRNQNGAVKVTVANPKSNTFLIHGGPATWEGNVGFNDTHVDFETALDRAGLPGLTYRDSTGKAWPDLFFYDEPDDSTGANAFLGIFIKAGPRPADFSAIWD